MSDSKKQLAKGTIAARQSQYSSKGKDEGKGGKTSYANGNGYANGGGKYG